MSNGSIGSILCQGMEDETSSGLEPRDDPVELTVKSFLIVLSCLVVWDSPFWVPVFAYQLCLTAFIIFLPTHRRWRSSLDGISESCLVIQGILLPCIFDRDGVAPEVWNWFICFIPNDISVGVWALDSYRWLFLRTEPDADELQHRRHLKHRIKLFKSSSCFSALFLSQLFFQHYLTVSTEPDPSPFLKDQWLNASVGMMGSFLLVNFMYWFGIFDWWFSPPHFENP